MQLLYKEYYNIKSKTVCPIIQIGYLEKEKDIIPNFKEKIEYYDTQEEAFVVNIPFSNGIFFNQTSIMWSLALGLIGIMINDSKLNNNLKIALGE